MGGKTGTTTSSVAIPPEVLARYNAVNNQAQDTAATPFKQYSTDASAFVAPLNAEQQAATAQTNQYANAAQPALQYVEQGYTPQGFQQGVQGYMNPFLSNAMGATAAQMNNVNQQQQQQMIGSAIGQGAFGGDRANIGLGNLENQQNLAEGQTLGQMASQGFQNAAQNYQTGLGQIGNFAVQGQQAGLQGAQAMMGAGTLAQQTEQAGKSALYNQFQQQQAYPFQVAQFLANIAEGTGALSGSTTTTTGPQSWFSDVRLKHDIKRVGTAKNGLPIYTFKYKGDDTEQTHVGYMAQDVEKVHPEAVGESHGFKTVDYDKASEPAHKYAGGGVTNSEGGVVAPEHSREGYFNGGDVINPYDLSALLAAQQRSYAPFQQGGLYGGQAGGTPGGKGVVPAANLFVPHLAVANPARTQQGDTLMGDVQNAMNIGDTIKKANDYRKDIIGHPAVAAQAAVPANAQTGAAAQPAVAAQDATGLEWLKTLGQPQGQAHGGVVGYADGGGVEPYQTDDPMSQVVSDTEQDKNKHGLMTAQNPTGQPSSTLGDLGKIASLAALPGEIASGAGAAASGIGSLMAMLAPIGLASGGVVPREHHANPDDTNGQSNVVGNGDQTPNYEALAQATAQKYGLNPKDFGSVIKGESGFNPKAIGDDGSSAGLGQFHIAGASEKYPHAGLGDDYISARNPELAESGTAQDKIAYLSDPANAPDQLDFMGQHVAKNGYGAWTAAKNLGLADLPAKNAAPAGADGNGQQGFQTPDSETPKKSLGDTLMSEQFLVPLLSGLGTMAGSNSRYLGAAILQGIGGGAKAYEDVQSNIANRGLTGAQTSQQQAITRGEDISNLQKSLQQTPTGNILWLSDGTPMEASEYIRRQKAGEKLPKVIGMAGNKMVNPEVGQATTDGTKTALPVLTPPVEQPTYGYSDISKKYAQNEPSTALEGGIQSSNLLKQGETYRQMVTANALDAKENAQSIAAGAANLAAVAGDKSLLGQSGAAYDTRSQIASIGNTVARMLTGENNYFGHGETQAQIATKIDRLRAAASASQDGQRALGAISLLESANANASQNPDAFGELEAKMLTQNQRSIDQARHLDKYGRESGQRYSNASTAFEAEMPVAQYQREAAALKEFMLSSPPAFSDAMNGKYTPAELNEAFASKGLKNMSRYFTGGEQ